MAKTIFSGLEDSGKSLMLATYAGKILERNAGWLKITGVPRPIYSNLEFREPFMDYAKELGIPVYYWKDLEELPRLGDCDLIIDEVGAYFDSRTFKDLPLDIRLWLAQASKLGVDVYGSAQDFAQVDKSFRRLVSDLIHVTKLIGSRDKSNTMPDVKTIWGLCTVRTLDPQKYDEAKSKFENTGMLPQFMWISRKDIEVYDTTAEVKVGHYPPLRHIARECELVGCDHVKTIHV